MNPFGLVRYHVLFVIDIATRCVCIGGITSDPNGEWMKQVARNLTDMWDGFLLGKRYLIHDRDPLFTWPDLNAGLEFRLCFWTGRAQTEPLQDLESIVIGHLLSTTRADRQDSEVWWGGEDAWYPHRGRSSCSDGTEAVPRASGCASASSVCLVALPLTR